MEAIDFPIEASLGNATAQDAQANVVVQMT